MTWVARWGWPIVAGLVVFDIPAVAAALHAWAA